MANVKPLVKELLTLDEVEAIIKASDVKHPGFDIDDYLLVSKGWFTTWDGDRHIGYIVHHIKHVNLISIDVYFMEVEKKGNPVVENGTYVYHNIRYHKWVPISVLCRDKRLEKTMRYIPIKTVDELVDRIANPRDEWGLFPADMNKPSNDLENSVKLEYNSITTWTEPIPAEELVRIEAEKKVEEERLEKELIERFSAGELPEPEDDLWYQVLADVDSQGFGDKTLETKVLKILNDRGINAYIDGERDSFGWVTRGILIDGKVMCIY